MTFSFDELFNVTEVLVFIYFILTINITIVVVVVIIIITDDMILFLTQTLYQLKTLEGSIHTQLSPYKYTLNMNSTMP